MIYSDSTFLIWQKGPRFGRYHWVGLRGNNYICFTVQLRHWIILQRDFSTFTIYICELFAADFYMYTLLVSSGGCLFLQMLSAHVMISSCVLLLHVYLHLTDESGSASMWCWSHQNSTLLAICAYMQIEDIQSWLALIVRVITPSGISSGVITLLRDELWKMRYLISSGAIFFRDVEQCRSLPQGPVHLMKPVLLLRVMPV